MGCVDRREYLKLRQRDQRRQRRERRDAIKLAAGCQDCPPGTEWPPECLHFDHRPDEVKLHNVAAMQTNPWTVVLAEIAKCDVVCANHHAIRTGSRRSTA